MTLGVDYASVDRNAQPDFTKFRAAGGSFLWIRASYGYSPGANTKKRVITADPHFQRDWKNAKAAGLTCGAYLFPVLEGQLSPEEQVKVFVDAVAAQGGLQPGIDFPPALDIEFPQGIAGTGLDRAGVMTWLRRAIAALRQAYGVWPVLYSSGRVWNQNDADCLGNPAAPDLVACPLWLACYALATGKPAVLPPPVVALTSVPTPFKDQWFFHQCQGDAKGVPGFNSTVDVNRFRTASPGDKGGHVEWLQRKLVTLPGPQVGPLNASGVYDADLELAVRAIQTKHGLVVDGIVGPSTFAAIAWL